MRGRHTRFVYLFPSRSKGAGPADVKQRCVEKETGCYALIRCAMFVLYTGSGETLLLATDSGLSVVVSLLPFEPLRRGGADDVTLSSLGGGRGRRVDNSGCYWM